MLKFGRAVVKARVPIVIIALLLLIPAALGMVHTRINYNMLDYLPKDIDTVKGQDILLDDFGKGGFSLVIVEGMDAKDVASLKTRIEQVDHVASVVWYDSLADLSVPMQMLPDDVYDAFNRDDETMMAVFFDTSTSADETMEAVSQIRSLAGKQCFVSGLSALVTDLKNLCQEEEPIYVAIAVLCACAAMMLLLDNWITPLLFLAGIGMTILYNMGTNYFLGEISYISKALAAVLQLAVTMDYSIFLWHSYGAQKTIYADRKEAMARAIAESVTAISGSCLTTIAGFIAMCFMSYTMGMDLGIVMAKGVLLGVIGCFTILPSLLLIFDRLLDKTGHKPLIPPMEKLAGFVTKRYWIFLLVFAGLLVPALYGYLNAPKSYDFTSTFSSQSIPAEKIPFNTAAEKLRDDFDIATTHMILCNADMSSKDATAMIGEIEKVDGVLYVLGKDSVVGSLVPDDMLPDSLRSELEADGYQLILINSSYKVSTDECNAQLDAIDKILKHYDPSGMLIGEASCTKDLIRITDHDFTVVTWASIGMVFLIILLTLRSISLPVILVTVIEFAIFINLGIPYYQDKSMLFLAPICLSTIQLGATVDYAILLTTHYKTNRRGGMKKRGAITEALTVSIPSILVSSCGLFAATIGVSIYSDIGVISDMCSLMARGAIVSMLCVVFVLPALLMPLDKIIVRTSLGMKPEHKDSGEVIH